MNERSVDAAASFGKPRALQRYSFWRLAARALRGNRDWSPAWREVAPGNSYDVIVVGGGGHGLATAYYLAKNHGVRRVAVLERRWIGGGNSGRNTQAVRSNYFYGASTRFYDRSLTLYETLGQELNFNIMLRQRGLIVLAHSDHELEMLARWRNALRMNGVDARSMTLQEIRRCVPGMNRGGRYPVLGGFFQPRGGIARHDAVVWAYARAASALGVDIVENCEVNGFLRSGQRITGVETSRGTIQAGSVVLAVAGDSALLAARAGVDLPLVTMALQAMVTEPVKPLLDVVLVSATVHAYISQSDRGEFVIGGAADVYPSYVRSGSLAVMRKTVAAAIELMPFLSRLRMMRQWGGAVDISPDTSPIMGPTPLEDFYVSCGWGTGGFKAIPAGGEAMASTVATKRVHPLISPFTLARFESASLVDEAAAAGVSH